MCTLPLSNPSFLLNHTITHTLTQYQLWVRILLNCNRRPFPKIHLIRTFGASSHHFLSALLHGASSEASSRQHYSACSLPHWCVYYRQRAVVFGARVPAHACCAWRVVVRAIQDCQASGGPGSGRFYASCSPGTAVNVNATFSPKGSNVCFSF